MSVLDDLRTGKVKPEDMNVDLFKTTKDKLIKGVEKGAKVNFDKIDYSSKDYNFLMEMRSNVYAFARCKEYQQLRAMNDLLLDKKGNVVPFQVFQRDIEKYRREVLKLNEEYNKDWLRTEYNMAIAQAQSAVLWKDFEANKDIFPNLRYKTAGDERVRHSHAVLEGITKPVDDPVWNKIAPVKDWGCRCILEPTTDNETTGDLPKGYNPNPVFEGNVGKDGAIFPEKHSYFTKNKVNMQKMREEAEGFWAEERKAVNRKVWDDYADDKNYIREQFNEKTGGFVIRHKDAEYPHFLDHPSSEQKVITHLVERGNRIVIPEYFTKDFDKNFDLTVDNSNWDIKEVKGDIKDRTEERIKSGLDQAGNIILLYDRVLSLEDISNIKRGLGNVKNEARLNAILIINEGKQAVINKSDLLRKDYKALDAF